MILTDRVYYVNSRSDVFTLNGDGNVYMDINPLRSFEWEYTLSNSISGLGGKASGFARRPRTVDLEVRMRGGSRAQAVELFNRFHAVTEADCMAEEPGRLYVGTQYIVCYLSVTGSILSAPRLANWIVRDITALIVEPYWCTETTTIFNVSTAEEIDLTGKKFDLRYPYRYGSGYTTGSIINTHYAACPAVITIYGPVENPVAIIAGTTYNVDVQLTSSERLVIDQTTHEIYTVNANGVRTNVFNKRNKEHDIFKYIPIGASDVLYDGTFKMSVSLVQMRSELEWR